MAPGLSTPISVSFTCDRLRVRRPSAALRPLLLQLPRVNFSALSGGGGIGSGAQRADRFLLRLQPAGPVPGTRSYGMLAVRMLRGALKLRYLLLGGAVTGGVSLNNVKPIRVTIVHGQ